MKKICILFLAIILFIPRLDYLNYANAETETSTYAKALVGCTLYKTSSLENDLNNIYFLVPETYFVLILDTITDKCFKVQYDKYIGYVDSSTVVIATFIPVQKTLKNITFDLKGTAGTQIWSIPSTSGNILTTVSAGTTKISYVGYVYGTIPQGGESNLWYYVSFTSPSKSTNVYEGYIYSENTTNLSEIISNTESNPEVISENNSGIFYLTTSLKTILIVFISVPVVLLISIILYKFIKKHKNNTNNHEVPSNYQNEYFNENIDQNSNSFSPLREEVSKMQHTTYIKKSNQRKFQDHQYPEFPTYNSDDDLL